MTQNNQLSLVKIGRGVAEELFLEELQKVLDNIVDPNTEEKAILARPRHTRPRRLLEGVTMGQEKRSSTIRSKCNSCSSRRRNQASV